MSVSWQREFSLSAHGIGWAEGGPTECPEIIREPGILIQGCGERGTAAGGET